jgi:hypothetical protein
VSINPNGAIGCFLAESIQECRDSDDVSNKSKLKTEVDGEEKDKETCFTAVR